MEEEDGGDVAIADELLARAEQDLVNAGGTVPTQVPLPTISFSFEKGRFPLAAQASLSAIANLCMPTCNTRRVRVAAAVVGWQA